MTTAAKSTTKAPSEPVRPVRRKTFKYSSTRPKDNVIIDLEGVEITCRPGMDGLTLMEFSERVSGVATMDEDLAAGIITEEEASRLGMVGATAFIKLLKAVILESEWPKFEAAVKDQEIALEQLTEIASWLIEVYSNRPTE